MTKIDFISLLRIHNNNISVRLQDRIWKFLVNICCKLKMSPVTSVNKGWCSHSWKGGAPWGDSGWERAGHWPQTGEVHIKGTITGRSQYWLHAGSVSLTIAIHCFCQGTLPLCMNVKVTFLQLTGRQSDPHQLWMAAEKKKWTNTLLLYKINGLWHYFLASSPLCPIKEPGIQTPIRWLFWHISPPSSQSARFPNKVIILCLNTCL